MKKEDLIQSLAQAEGITVAKANHIVNTLVQQITIELLDGGNVKIRNFGTFTVTKRKGKQFKNPKTGTLLEIPERSHPLFVPSKSLKDKLQKEGGTDDK